MRIGILGGKGLVGSALSKIYEESIFGKPLIKDKDVDEFDRNLDILNVCIPYSDEFINVVVTEIFDCKPDLTIIHSTVAPYTTLKIKEKTKTFVVHSPVRGTHDNLYKSLKIFRKYIGTDEREAGVVTKKHFKQLKFKMAKIYNPSIVTELNKLISTTYFGVCIAFTDYVDKLCEQYKIPFSTFEHFNESYNRGYRRLRMRKVNRPTLYPPKGPIGSTCVIPNAKILQKYLDHKLIQSILEVK